MQATYGATSSPWAGTKGGDEKVLTLAAGEFITQAYAKWVGHGVDEIWCARQRRDGPARLRPFRIPSARSVDATRCTGRRVADSSHLRSFAARQLRFIARPNLHASAQKAMDL